MNNKPLKELLKLYKQLPYIIYKKKYLIPQKPENPRNPLFGKYTNPLNLAKKYFPQQITLQMIQNNKNGQNTNLSQQVKQIFLKEKLLYKQKLFQYKEKYVKPLNFSKTFLTAQFLYYKKNCDQVLQKLNKNTPVGNFVEIRNYFKDLPESQKQKYIEMSKELIEQNMKKQIQLENQLRIPNQKRPASHMLYLRQVKDVRISPQMYSQYKKLPPDIKKVYSQKAKQMKLQNKIELQNFLQKRNITVDQFNFIKQTCSKIQKIKRQLRQERKKQKIKPQVLTQSVKIFQNQKNVQEFKIDVAQNFIQDSQSIDDEWQDQIDDRSQEDSINLKKQLQKWINLNKNRLRSQKIKEQSQKASITNNKNKQSNFSEKPLTKILNQSFLKK